MAKISEYSEVNFIFPDDLFLKSSEGDTQTVSAGTLSSVMGGGKSVLLLTDTGAGTENTLGQTTITVKHESEYEDAIYSAILSVDGTAEIPLKYVGQYTVSFKDDEEKEYVKVVNIPQLGVIAKMDIAKFKGTVWGYYEDFSDKASLTSIRYNVNFDGEPVENFDYEPMYTNSQTGTAKAGDWQPFLTDVLKNLPYMVGPDGEADYQLDPDDYTKKIDGTESDYKNTSYVGGAFAWLNRIYMEEIYEGAGRYVYFSDTDDWEGHNFFPVGFVDSDRKVLEGVWLPMGYMDASGRTLIQGTTPVASKTCPQEKAIIDGFSSRGRFLGGPILNLLHDLELMLYRATDIQYVGGYGRCNAGSQAVTANQVVPNGPVKGFYGAGNKTTMNKAFHSQVLFSYQQYIRDPYTLLVNGVLKFSPYYDYDITGASYETAANNGGWNTGGGWWYPSTKFQLSKEMGSFPKFENTASTTTGLCDGVYGSTSGVRVALRLGACGGDLIDGPAYVHLSHEASDAAWYNGVALLLLPEEGYAPQAA